MVERFKIAFIGIGSQNASKAIFENIKIFSGVNPIPIEIALGIHEENIAQEIQRKIYPILHKMNSKNKADILLTYSPDQEKVLTNADFVIQSIFVDNEMTKLFDLCLPLKFGIPQSNLNIIGPGGIFNSFRTNRITAKTTEIVKKICPKAPLLIQSNPIATNILAAKSVNSSINAFGLGSNIDADLKPLKKYIKKNFETEKKSENSLDFYFQYAGLDRFRWLTKAIYGGFENIDNLKENAHDLMEEKYGKRGFNFNLLKQYQAYCIGSPEKFMDFLPEYYNYFNFDTPTPYWNFKMDINKGYEIENTHLMRLLYDFIDNNPNNNYNLNVVNQINGNILIDKLPEDCVIELPTLFKDKQIQPVDKVVLRDNIYDILLPLCNQQKTIVKASLGNDLELVLEAMRNEPMNQWIEDEDKIDYLTKLMLHYERKWLPREWAEWIPTEEELKKNNWWIPKTDLVKKNDQYLKRKFPIKEDLRSKIFNPKELEITLETEL